MVRSALITALLIGIAGCGNTGGTNNNNPGPTPDLAMPAGPDLAPFDPGPYPEPVGGKYGVDEGQTLFNIKAKGYRFDATHTDATELSVEDISIDDVIRHNPQCKCLVLAQSAIWCGPCNAEQPILVQAVADDPSFCVFNVLLESTPGKIAVPADLVTWNSHAQNFPVVIPNISTKVHLPTPDAIPTNTIIKPSTMEILKVEKGLGKIEDYKALCGM